MFVCLFYSITKNSKLYAKPKEDCSTPKPQGATAAPPTQKYSTNTQEAKYKRMYYVDLMVYMWC